MIISVNWLKELTSIDHSIEELSRLIGSRLVEIESVTDLSAKYHGVVAARVVTAQKLEGSDHLNVTTIDDGGVTEGVERNDEGYIQVVCGASNVREGLIVAWLPPGSTVPETYGKEPFVLGARKLMGVTSNGMIASAKELDLFDDHDGILELESDIAPGSSFAENYALDDYLLDIENKSLTHRPDAFGVIGFAREVAAIQGLTFETPAWLKQTQHEYAEPSETLPITAQIDDPSCSARYQAIVMRDVDGVAVSPLPLQTYLARIGIRPHSAVVDVTNYLMMATGQPLHAFDYDKLKALNNDVVEIHVRYAHDGETLALLDGRTIELSTEDIVIANGDTPVALAGAMGGAATEIDSSTKNIVIESATFDLYRLRATQMRHGIFSEAITRFTKGQPAELTAPVLAEAVRLLEKHASATVASLVAEDYPTVQQLVSITVPIERINAVLGTDYNLDRVVEILERVEFSVEFQDNAIAVTAPYWRSDIHIAEDIIEEIGRINGFDNITATLPKRDFKAISPSAFDELRTLIRRKLTRGGASEVLTYSFVHGDILAKALQDPQNSYRITNSISPELQYYRQSLTPSLLGLVHPNLKQGYDTFALYELNKVHHKIYGLDEEGVPGEIDSLALVVADKKSRDAAFYHARTYADWLGAALGMKFEYAPLSSKSSPLHGPYTPHRSAKITDAVTGKILGVVGEFEPQTVRGYKLPVYCAGFEVDVRALFETYEEVAISYTPLSRYPGTDRDVCFRVDATISYHQLTSAVESVLSASELETSLKPIDIYQGDDTTKKQITYRITINDHKKTITSEDANHLVSSVIDAARTACEAVVV